MRPTDFASLEIKAWQHVLAEQERTERMQDAALERSDAATFYALRGRVRVLRQHAALLLAKAVEKKLSLRLMSGQPRVS